MIPKEHDKSMYIPVELELLIATQKSCKGLGSEAEAS